MLTDTEIAKSDAEALAGYLAELAESPDPLDRALHRFYASPEAAGMFTVKRDASSDALAKIAKFTRDNDNQPSALVQVQKRAAEDSEMPPDMAAINLSERVFAKRRADPTICSYDQAVAKIAESRDATDQQIWRQYRAAEEVAKRIAPEPLPAPVATMPPDVAARVAELRKIDPSIKSDAVAVARIATSRNPADMLAWRAYRKAEAADALPDDATLRTTIYGANLVHMFDAMQAPYPGMSRETARQRTMELGRAQTLLRRHHQELAGAPLQEKRQGDSSAYRSAGHRGPAAPAPIPGEPGNEDFSATEPGRQLAAMITAHAAGNPKLSRGAAQSRLLSRHAGAQKLLFQHHAALAAS